MSFRNASLVGLLLLLLAPLSGAEESHSFGVVPQQAVTKLAQEWGPMLAKLSAASGVSLKFSTAPDIPTFELRARQGEYDFAYMNPYHYVVFHERPGYNALVHARDAGLHGIIVTRRDSPFLSLRDLAGQTLAFPSPAAFAASILTRAELQENGVPVSVRYVGSHDSVYLGVARGLYPAGGGVNRTFKALPPETAAELRVIWRTQTYTSHPIAVHPRVPAAVAARVKRALETMGDTEEGRALLQPLQVEGWIAARDTEWDSIRKLGLDALEEESGH